MNTNTMRDVRTAWPTASPTPAGPPGGGVAVVGVYQHDGDCHDDDREERPDQVGGVEKGFEIVVVDAGGLAVDPGRTEASRRESTHHRHAVQRDDHHHPGHHPGGHQISHRADRHHLERVDLVCDTHRAQLGGGARADGGGEADACHRRRDDPHVHVSGDESRHRFDADAGKLVVSLNRDDRAGGQREEADDHHRAADHGQRTGAQAHLSDQSEHFRLVAGEGHPGFADCSGVERHLDADLIPAGRNTACGMTEPLERLF